MKYIYGLQVLFNDSLPLQCVRKEVPNRIGLRRKEIMV